MVSSLVIFVKYSTNPKRIGKDRIAIPDAFYKKISNKSKNYEKCFYYKNVLDASSEGDRLKNHMINCDNINWIKI